MLSRPLWSPSGDRKQDSNMQQFLHHCEHKHGLNLTKRQQPCYDMLHNWSVGQPQEFWQTLTEFVGVKWQQENHQRAFEALPDTPMYKTKWFVGSKLNYAENLLERGNPGDLAILAMREGLDAPVRITRADLKKSVQQLVELLLELKVKKGDRVVGVVANSEFAVIALLACSSIGAIWSSCSPDFGVQAVADRFAQLEPKVMLFDVKYHYNGKEHCLADKIQLISKNIPSIQSFIAPALVDLAVDKPLYILSDRPDAVSCELKYAELNFDDPLYILFSSGTTGMPKCIVHSIGRALLQHQKELMLHCDMKKEDKLFYFTTCGWMMWNWMVSALSLDVAIVCWEGSPVYPDYRRLWGFIEQEEINVFGTSPRYLKTLEQNSFAPKDEHSLGSLQAILSTGAPLVPEQFDWVYKNIKSDLHLASISGGTDLVSCFMLGNPMAEVRAGELQAAGLGMAVEVWNSKGERVKNQKGELVCTKPFVSMPLVFWNDSADEIYQKSYFHKYPDIWCHGDFVEEMDSGGFVIHGRSDSTLNPAGVRIGTAELYRVVETLEEVADSLAVSYESGGEVSILLFIKLQSQGKLVKTSFDVLTKEIRKTVREQLSPRHVPQQVFAVADIPYTRSGKKVESSVQLIMMGQMPKNLEALANPECLDEYDIIGQNMV